MRSVVLVAFILSLSACVAREIEVVTPFNPLEVAYINRSGPASISGQAFVRQRGGGIVTCAGEAVDLVPAGQFATERITQIYGSSQGGFINALQGVSQANVPPEYLSMVRRATCDAQGNFEFRGVANGSYYILTSVLWTVGNQIIPEGGGLSQRVEIRNGQSQSVILSP